MAEMTAEMDQMQVPDGGVASFMMSDEDIVNLEREEDQQLAEEVYGGEGISQFTDMAAQMASLGRFGDDVIVHAQTGELIIPKKILDDNPEIKEAVFEQLMAQGVENPEQYVVGSGSASINPETGLPEYFFKRIFRPIKKAVSSIAKGVKKVASKVVKVAKKVAPIVLPIALTLAFPALGAYGAALGSGIGTLIQGGSFKDALKSAALSGLSSAAFSGISNIGGEGGFTGGFTQSLANPGARFAQVGGQLKSGFSGQGFNFGQEFVDPSLAAKASTTGAKTTPTADGEVVSAQEQYISDIMGGGEQLPAYTDTQAYMGPPSTASEGVLSEGMPAARPYTGAPGNQSISTNTQFGPQPTKFSEKLGEAYKTAKEYATTGYDKGKDLLFGAPEKSVTDVLKDPSFIEQYGKLDPNTKLEYAKALSGDTQKNLLQQVAPYAVTGGAVMYGTGMFDTPPPTPEEDSPLGVKRGPTGYDRFMANQDQFMVNTAAVDPIYTAPLTQYVSYSDFYNPSTFALPSSRPREGGPFYRPPVQTAAQGGEIFPRRTGGIMPDEGIPGKDSVRAMLMPGEFVMTTDAVKGMGDGDLRRGIQDMYGVMANLERKGRMA